MNQIETNTKILQKVFINNRIRILEQLSEGETCVCKLVDLLEIKHNLLSHHLNTLTELGFTKSTRNGRHIKYSIATERRECVKKILALTHTHYC